MRWVAGVGELESVQISVHFGPDWSKYIQIEIGKMLSVQNFVCLYPLFGPRSFEHKDGIGKSSSLERAYELEYGLYPWPLDLDTSFFRVRLCI